MIGEKSSPTADTQANVAPAAAATDTTNTAAAPEGTSSTLDRLLDDMVAAISDYAPKMAIANRRSAASAKTAGADQIRNKTILMRLLQAVAYGMESKEANDPVKASDARDLFKSHLFAKDLLLKSPEFLLARGDVTDWAKRTFKNITAFEYALWAKDFKMIEMMLRCIPETKEGDAIRAALLEQYNQVTAPAHAGGGLTYTHTYDRPNLDASGIPDDTTTNVTEVHTENHFDITPLCNAYQNYDTNFNTRTWPQREAYWPQMIGKLQRLLPIHILQRYCDPNTPFYPLPQFNSEFKRSTNFYDYMSKRSPTLFGVSPSANVGLVRMDGVRAQLSPVEPALLSAHGLGGIRLDLAAIRRLDAVSTNEIERMIRQSSQPRHVAGSRP